MNSNKTNKASFSARLLAHNIDLIPILILLYAASFLIPRGYDLFIFSGIYLIYYVGFEASNWQATPGKKWTKLKVVDLQGQRASLGMLFFRNLFKFVSLIVFFGGFIMILLNEKKQGLHDFIGGTIVLFKED